MNAEVLEKFLDYVYTGEVEVTIWIFIIVVFLFLGGVVCLFVCFILVFLFLGSVAQNKSRILLDFGSATQI